MAAVSWNSAVSADWSVAADWSTGIVPNGTDDVTVSIAGTYTVGIASAEAAKSITLNNASATISDNASLTLTGALSLTAGTFTLAGSGVITGGTIVDTAGTLVAAGGTLSGVTYWGTLDLSANYANIADAGGLILKGTGGVGSGIVNFTGYDAYMRFTASSTLNSATINAGNVSYYDFFNIVTATTTVTLGPALTVQQTGNYVEFAGNYSDDLFINQGTINAGFAGGRLVITGGSFTNTGSISDTNTDSIDATGVVFANSGKITVGGGTLTLSNWTNTGTIALTSGVLTLGTASSPAWTSVGTITTTGGTLNLGGTFTGTQLGALSISSTQVNITGTLNNAGNILYVGTASLGTVGLSGLITGGSVYDGGKGLIVNSGTLTGVTYRGTLDLSANYQYLHVNGPITLTGTSGTGAGAVNLTGYASYIYVDSATTFNNATINFGNASTYSYLNLTGTGTTLTLGSTLTLNQTGTYGYISGSATDKLLNQGNIVAGATNGRLIITGGTFSNQGTLTIQSGESVDLTGVSLLNSGTIQVNGGTLSLASFSNTGGLTVTSGSVLNIGGSLTTANLLTLPLAGVDVGILGTLNNTGGTLALGPLAAIGGINLVSNATIVGGAIVDSGSNLVGQGGTLSGVTFRGTLDLSNSSASLQIANGITLQGTGGTGPGTILLDGYNDYLYFPTSETLDNATIDFGYSNTDYIYTNAGGVTLTLGSNLNIVQIGSNAQFYLPYSGDTVINKGTINAGVVGNMSVQYGTFTNQGVINVTNGDSFSLYSTTFTNSGTINVTGGIFTLASFTNTGHININAGSTLSLGGTNTTTQVSSFTFNGADFIVTGTLTNTGATLNIGATSGITTLDVVSNGTIVGGTIADSGGGLLAASGTLSSVTYLGTMDLSGTSEYLALAGTPIFGGTGGVGSGTVLLNGYNDYLYIANSMTLSKATIDIGNNTTDYLYLNAAGVTLTLASTLTIDQTGLYAQVYAPYANDLTVNQGTILADVAGGRFLFQYGSFTNTGLIASSNGDSLDLSGATVTNISGTLLTSGSYSAGAGSILQLSNNATINALYLSSVTLDGVGSVIQSYNTSSSTQVSLDTMLSRIAAGATLSLLDGRNFTDVASGGTFTDSGKLVLGNSTLTATKFLLSTGYLSGTGTVAAPIVVSGANTLNGGGTLTLTGSLSGTGTISIAAGTTVNLANAGATGATGLIVQDSGTLGLSGQTLTIGSLTTSATGVVFGYGTMTGTVTDSGLLDANGGTLYVAGLTGISAGTWSGGGLEADASSVLRLANNATISSDAGSIVLDGPGSAIESYNTTASAYVFIDSTLSGVTTTGTLSLLDGRNFTAVAASGTFTDAGNLVLDGSNFTATQLVLNSGATISGNGTLTGPITVNGPASFTGGTVGLTGAVSGAGTLNIAATELLVFAAAAAPSFTGLVNDLGTLQVQGGTLATGGVSIGATGIVTGFGTLTGAITDNGLVDATGGTLNVAGLTNITSGTLTGGQIEADAGSVLQLANNLSITTIAGGVTLSGTGSVIQSKNTTSNAQVSLLSTLTTIAATGTLALLNRSYTASYLTDAGVLTLNGGTLTATKLTISAGGQFFDAGTVVGPIANSGTVNIALGTTLSQTAGGALGGTYTGLGTLVLGGATPFSITPAVTITTGLLQVTGSLTGSGTILAPLEIDGVVKSYGGTLTLDGALTGTGTLTGSAGATLVLADGGTFFGVVNGAGTLINNDLINGVAQGVSLAGTGVLTITNNAGGEIYAGSGDAAVLVGGTEIVNNTGAIGGTRNGITFAGTTGTIINSGIISGDSGAAILASTGTLKVVNTGLIANYEGVGTAALSLNGATTSTIDTSGTIIGGEFLASGSAIQFGAGSDRLILRPSAVVVGTVRGGAGTNVLELAKPTTGTATGTISGLGTQYLQFSSIVEDAGAGWIVTGSNKLITGVTSSVSLGAAALLTVDGLLTAPGGETITGPGTVLIDSTGTLATGTSGGTTAFVTISTATLTDQGLIDVTVNKTLSLTGTVLSNLTGGTLTGGGFELDSTATIQLANNGSITTDNASIVLNGAGGKMQWLDTSSNTTKTLTTSLGTIGATGTLTLLNGAGFAAAGALADNGTITLTGGTVSAATTLTVGATGTLIGSGTVGGSLSVAGLVEASGGSLTLSGNVGGAGTIGIDVNSVLSASGTLGISNIAFLSDGGQLNLSQPASVAGTIAGFASTDVIDILGQVVTSDSFVANTLTLTGSGGTIGVLHFAGDYSGYHFGLFSDGSGGTNILLT
jgi:hypothetical protein